MTDDQIEALQNLRDTAAAADACPHWAVALRMLRSAVADVLHEFDMEARHD